MELLLQRGRLAHRDLRILKRIFHVDRGDCGRHEVLLSAATHGIHHVSSTCNQTGAAAWTRGRQH